MRNDYNFTLFPYKFSNQNSKYHLPPDSTNENVHTQNPATYLLGRCDGAERNLRKLLWVEGTVGDSAHELPGLLHDGHRSVSSVQDEPRDVFLGHIGQLLSVHVLQIDQPAVVLLVAVVGKVDETDLTGGLINSNEVMVFVEEGRRKNLLKNIRVDKFISNF